jgi:uncharacterized protein YdaU (DUF1376 family)
MSAKPWMPLYIADYLKKTTHLGALESGAYLHLMMDYWQNGGLPSDDKRLARIARMTDREWKSSKETIRAFFHSGWKHKRIDEELTHATDVSSKRAAAAATREASKRARDLDQTEHGDGSNDPSIDDTLHTTQRRKKDTADAVTSKAYAFEDGIIRLNQRDFEAWQRAYSHLDLPAELLSLSKWASEQGERWFHALKGALAKRNRDVKAEQERLEKEGGFQWNGTEGVI